MYALLPAVVERYASASVGVVRYASRPREDGRCAKALSRGGQDRFGRGRSRSMPRAAASAATGVAVVYGTSTNQWLGWACTNNNVQQKSSPVIVVLVA